MPSPRNCKQFYLCMAPLGSDHSKKEADKIVEIPFRFPKTSTCR